MPQTSIELLQSSIAIFLGGGFGSVLRFLVSFWIADRFGDDFPVGTLVVNVTGCFAIGVIATITSPEGGFPSAPLTRQFLMIGICGGYTTFSSFSFQALALAKNGEWFNAALYCLLSVVLCLLGVWAGMAFGTLRWR